MAIGVNNVVHNNGECHHIHLHRRRHHHQNSAKLYETPLFKLRSRASHQFLASHFSHSHIDEPSAEPMKHIIHHRSSSPQKITYCVHTSNTNLDRDSSHRQCYESARQKSETVVGVQTDRQTDRSIPREIPCNCSQTNNNKLVDSRHTSVHTDPVPRCFCGVWGCDAHEFPWKLM